MIPSTLLPLSVNGGACRAGKGRILYPPVLWHCKQSDYSLSSHSGIVNLYQFHMLSASVQRLVRQSKSILGMIDAESFVKLEIQRPFVWKRSQMLELIDSLYQGYPTGYITTWKNPDVITKNGGRANGKMVLIDGQQRIAAT